LVDVLGTLKAPGTSDDQIWKFLSTPSIEWKKEVTRNQSANIDPTTATKRITWDQAVELYKEMAPGCKIEIFDQMIELSE
jgi:hypothetical protein